MDAYMPMSTTTRHNRIITTLIGKLFDLIEQKAIHVLQSDCALVYWGRETELHSLSLVDIENPKNKSVFKESVINELSYVQPDLMLFQKNKYTENKWNTRTAGCPDLIIEIWSEGNTQEDKAFKKFLYSTSDKTEHWYIEQDSNDVICFLGQNPLPAQSLLNILRTGNEIELDLRRIAIQP